MLREGIRPPKFADKFYEIDFEAEPMPVLSLYPFPDPLNLDSLEIELCDLGCEARTIDWSACSEIPTVRMEMPLICSIFNWVEVVEWEGVPLGDFLDFIGFTVPTDGYLAFYSRDGNYFESVPGYMARDPLVLLATGLNGQPLPIQHGGPLRLVVPFLQGYKSVKWLGAIRAFAHDPAGIKRLLGHSKTGLLGRAWQERYSNVPPVDSEGKPV